MRQSLTLLLTVFLIISPALATPALIQYSFETDIECDDVTGANGNFHYAARDVGDVRNISAGATVGSELLSGETNYNYLAQNPNRDGVQKFQQKMSDAGAHTVDEYAQTGGKSGFGLYTSGGGMQNYGWEGGQDCSANAKTTGSLTATASNISDKNQYPFDETVVSNQYVSGQFMQSNQKQIIQGLSNQSDSYYHKATGAGNGFQRFDTYAISNTGNNKNSTALGYTIRTEQNTFSHGNWSTSENPTKLQFTSYRNSYSAKPDMSGNAKVGFPAS